ncbi:MAG TPA: S-adenosylmethionine:tRNA ribosyltransferase-isomerase [Polyangiales bacterium]|nr:S-adenosylmethionine:tRNA ribosyltransferase-isomerase [Polyangiales bacterium]
MPPQPNVSTRLLVVDPAHARLAGRTMRDLPELLRGGDLLIVNDAATLPASLPARTASGASIELRLLGPEASGQFSAVVFGAGDYRIRTEDRPAPPPLQIGEQLQVGPQLTASVIARSQVSQRLVDIRFDLQGAELWRALYAWGKPVQYAYRIEPLPLWSVQTAYATRPWASEMPSAGKPISIEILLALAARNVQVATLTHAAGLSATGDPELDRALPLPERYELPPATVQAIADTRAAGGRIIAVGTSVVRALEAAYQRGQGSLAAGTDIASLRITPQHKLQVVDGLLTGIHAPEESHFELLGAFMPSALLEQSHLHARAHAYREHELGDECLILSESLTAQKAPRAA